MVSTHIRGHNGESIEERSVEAGIFQLIVAGSSKPASARVSVFANAAARSLVADQTSSCVRSRSFDQCKVSHLDFLILACSMSSVVCPWKVSPSQTEERIAKRFYIVTRS